MGGKTKGATSLNRRGTNSAEQWMPLLWAAKDNNLLIAEALLKRGHDVNKQEPLADKGASGYAPLHWAAQKGHQEMVELLLSRGASPTLKE
jgi:ankyrin repeat protein